MVGWIPEFVQYFTVLNHYSKQQKWRYTNGYESLFPWRKESIRRF
jgi:hypothetical protein